MSKYNLTDILNEFIGGGRIGTLKISFKDLQDKMDDLENSGKVIVRTLPGPSGDGKVNREFEVVDRDSAVPGGNKQERGFTVYDYKFGFDPGSEEHFMEEYPFSVGGNDLRLAMELIPDVVPYRLEEEIDENRREKNPEGMGQLYVQPAVQKAVKFHLDAYDKGDIEVDDMIQAIEDIIFGYVKAPGMREEDAIEDEPVTEDKEKDLINALRFQVMTLEKGIIDKDDFINAVEELAFGQRRGPMQEEDVDEVMGIDRKGNKKPDTDGSDATKFKKVAMSEEEMSKDEKRYTDTVAKMLKDRILKDIPMDIIIDFVKTHGSDIRRMNNSEIKDEFEEFFSVNYETGADYMDEAIFTANEMGDKAVEDESASGAFEETINWRGETVKEQFKRLSK